MRPNRGVLLDPKQLTQAHEAKTKTPLRRLEGAYTVPLDANPAQKKRMAWEALTKFITAMAQKGLKLHEKAPQFELKGPHEAHDFDTGLVLPGAQEWRIRADFQIVDFNITTQVIEYPTDGLTQDEKSIDVNSNKDIKEAQKALF